MVEIAKKTQLVVKITLHCGYKPKAEQLKV